MFTKYNMKISLNKTKSMAVAKDPRLVKLEIEGNIIEQVWHLNI